MCRYCGVISVSELLGVEDICLVVAVDIVQHRCKYTSLGESIFLSLPYAVLILEGYVEAPVLHNTFHKLRQLVIFSNFLDLVKQTVVVDCIIRCAQIDEGEAGDLILLLTIFDDMIQVEDTAGFARPEEEITEDSSLF